MLQFMGSQRVGSSHGRGLGPRDALKKDSRGLCRGAVSITNSRSSLKLTSIESVIPSSHLILCRPLLLLPPIPPSIRVFSNESPEGPRHLHRIPRLSEAPWEVP